MEVTEQDNIILDLYKGKVNTTVEQIRAAVERLDYYEDAEEEELDSAAERIYETFGVSKKVFKKAVGDLYKRRLIEISDQGIKLIS